MVRNKFDKDLDFLNEDLIEMGNLIESSIEAAVTALKEQNLDLAKSVIMEENEINLLEKKIESRCLKLLLQQQPVARDLRLISSALKMITDMERIGDQASDIAEISIRLTKQAHILELVHIPQMGDATIKMVKESINAFVNKDLDLAKEVILYDSVVDNLFAIVQDDLIDYLRQNLDNGEQAIDLLMIAKYLERIGDHAQNIAEWVYFSIEGVHFYIDEE